MNRAKTIQSADVESVRAVGGIRGGVSQGVVICTKRHVPLRDRLLLYNIHISEGG